jgi:signal peptidase
VDNPITPAQTQQLVAGDIITFHVANTSSNNLITHRVHAVEHVNGQVAYQTKGDANNTPDPELVTPQQIVGTYRSHIPYGGYVLQWAQQKIVFFVIIIVPVIYLVAMQIASHWNESDKRGDADAVDQSGNADGGSAAPEPVSVGSQTDLDQPNHALYPTPSLDGTDAEGGRHAESGAGRRSLGHSNP